MRNPLSNPQFLCWMNRVAAKFSNAWPGVNLFTRRGRFSPGWLVVVSLCALLAGCISLVEMTRHNASKKGRPTFAVTAAANVNPVAAKPPQEPQKAIGARPKVIITAKQKKHMTKSPEPVPVRLANSPASPTTLSYDVSLSPGAPAEGFEEQEGEDMVRARANWFYSQRAYPLGFIPPEALQRAIEQRDLMKQRQRAAAQTSGANAIISFPGDALWHLMGPQPVNEAFSANSGFPTASGRVTAIAVDPTDATGQTVYIGGAAGGVWKTIDGGTTWSVLTDTQPSLAVGAIAIDPNNHNTIYVGTGEDNFNGDAFYGVGILKSTDGGSTWTQLGAANFAGPQSGQTGGAKIGGIAVQPGNSSVLLASVFFFDGNDPRGGVWRSTDGGATWGRPTTGAQGAAGTGVVFESTGTTAWAALGDIFSPMATNNGVWKSTDSGANWTKQTGTGANILPTANVGRITLGYAPSTSGAGATVYAAIADTSTTSRNLLGFFKTTDGGTNWTTLGSTPTFCNQQCFYDMAVGVHPTNPNFVVVGGGAFTNNSTSLFKTTDGGTTWTGSTAPNDFTLGTTTTRPHVDTHAIVFAPNGATPRLYVGNDGGMWRTDNPTPTPPTWVDLNATLAITQFYPGPSAGIGDENFGFGGTQDNDTELFSGSLAWDNVFACGDGGFTAIDTNTPTTIYTSCDSQASHVVRRSVFNGSIASGQTFAIADAGIVRTDRMQFIPPLIIEEGNPTTLYFGTCRLWQTMNGAATWNPISGDLSAANAPVTTSCPGTGSITSIDVSHQSSSILLAGTSNGAVWQTTTGGALWNQIDHGLLPARHVTAVRTFRPDSTGNVAFVTFSGFGSCGSCDGKGHVFGTSNAGVTWTDLSGDLPDIPVNDIIVFHQGNPTFDALYIATDVGVFSCPDPTSGTPCKNWTVVGDGLPNSPVLGLTMRRESRILRAATHGRSMWQIQLTDISPPPLALSSSVTPAAAFVGDPTNNAVTVTGLNFSANTQVQFNGATTGVTTSFVSTTQLNVTLNSSLFTTGGVFPITLTDPAGVDPGSTFGTGGLPFTVMNPPLLSAGTMSPTSTTVGTPVTLHFSGGSQFVNSTQVTFNNFPLTGGTASAGGTVFDIQVPAFLLTVAGVVNVTVTNPLPGGGPTPPFGPFAFTINPNPGPTVVFNPSSIILGPIAVGANTSLTNILVQNAGGATLNITNATITGPNAANFTFVAPTGGTTCTFESTHTVSVPAGTACTFGIKFTAGTPPGAANSTATLSVFDDAAGSPQTVSITGLVGPVAVISGINFGSVAVGTTSPTMNSTVFNAGGGSVTVTALTLGGTNATDFHLVAAAPSGNPACGAVPFTLSTTGQMCDVGVTFTPSVIGAENATISIADNGVGSPQSAPLLGVGVQITSISPSIVATGGPAFTLTVNGGGFASSAVVNVNGSARLTTFVNSTQLLASIPAPDIVSAGSLAITVTSPSPGGTPSEPKTLVVAQAPSATNDNINFATTVSATPFRFTEDTTQATPNTAVNDPAVSCASNSVARSVWFKFVAPATGRVVADTRFGRYLTILSAWTGTPGSLVAVPGACASGNVGTTSPAPSLIGFPVTSGTTYFLMVTDASSTGPGGTLTFSLDFASAAPQNDDFNSAIDASSAPFTNTVNSILATTDTGGHADPTPSCTVGAAGLVASGKANTVWYKFSATANGTITADTLTSPYNTILTAVTGAPGSFTEVACNDNATISSTAVIESQVSFAATSGTTYFFMVSAFIGDGGTTTFHLNFNAGGVGAPTKLAFTTQPTNVAAGTSITPAVQVAVQDASGNTVTTATNSITMGIGTNPGSGALGGTVTVAAVNGVATFSNLNINKTGTGYTLTASATGLTGATSSAFNVTPGAASKLAFSVQPTNVVAGSSISPAVQVTVQDAQGNTVTTATNSIAMAIGTNPGGGTLSGTTPVAAVAGVATFSNLSINKTGTGYTLSASATGLTGATSGAFNVTPGAASKLAFTVQPSNVGAGAPITPAVQITVQDALGNIVTTATNSIAMAIGTNPGGGTLSGTTPVAAVAGVATFSNLSINNAGVGYTLVASATGLTSATSTAFNVTSGTAAKLAFTVQPSNVAAGASIAPPVQVSVEDSSGNVITTATNSITVAIGTNPGGGTLGGTLTVAAVNGVATFSNLNINKAGTGYTLTASAGGLTGATSNAFNVTAGAASKLAFTVQPTNVASGASITPAVQVTVQDAQGNTVTTATNSISMAIGTNPGGGTLSGTTPVAAVAGVATFSNLGIDKAGNGYTLAASATGLTGATSGAFNVTAGAAAKLAFTVQPTNVAAGSSITPAVQVTVQDAAGNTVTAATNSISMAIGTNPAGGTLSGTTPVAAVAGVATFSNLSINKTGNGYTLATSATGLTGATSNAFNVTPGAASKLAFTVQPTNVTAGASITPAVQVTVQDAQGNTVTTATNIITMAIGTNPSGGILSGTTSVAAVAGVATFSNLSINKTGTGYTLAATATGLTGATSTAFNVTAGTASKLAFTVQPTNVAAGASITPAVQVTVQDAQGNTVTTATNSITMAIGTNPSGGTLGGTTSVAAVAGVASFANLSINKTGTGYTLAASATGLTGATSTAFNVTAGAASKLAFTVQPTNIAAGASITPGVQVTVQDAQGNTVTTATNTITMAIGTNPSGGTLTGTTSVAAVAGVATFSNLSINKTGTGYTLAASATGLTGATSSAFNVTAGAASKLAFTVQPTNVTAGASISPAVQVTVQDAQGNTVTTATNTITMAIGTNPGGGTLSGTTSVAAVAGVATFSNLSINFAGAGYTLAASATGLTGATSSPFTVSSGAAAKNVFTVQPLSAGAGSVIAPPVQVSVEDALGNVVTTATNSITIAIGTNPGGGTLSGTTTAAAVNGVATFSNLSINAAGTGYTLTASATGLTTGTSNPFNITSGTPAKLAFIVQPSNVASGASIAPSVQVTIQDAQGNPVTTATNQVTVAIGTNPSGGTLSGTLTVAAVNGVATFSNLSINNLGNGYTLTATAAGLTSATSNAFNVTAGAPAKVVFTTQPSNATAGVAISPAVQVSIEDAGGNVVTAATNNVTIAIGTNPGGGTLSGTTSVAAVAGVATFSNLSIDKVGTGYTLSASATGLTGATSSAFNIVAGVPAKLAFTAQPSNVASGAAITPAVQVTVEDAQGNVVLGATNSITIAIGTNPSSGTLSGTTTVAAVNGVASFSTLSIDKAGTGYTLAASATGLTGATSNAFNVTPGAASKLAFTVQPTNVAAGASIAPAVQVTVEDAAGNTVTSATNSITIAIGTNPSGGTLGGTATVAAAGGVASFSNLTIDKVGAGYTLTASATGLSGAASSVFNVTAGAASKLIFTVQPSNVVAGVAIAPAVQVTIEDAGGNVVTTATNSVTIAIGANPGGGTLSGTTTVNAVAGVASFSTLSINKAGTGYTLTAAATGLTGATSSAFNVTAGPAAHVTATSGSPQNAVIGTAFANPLVATVTDANANVVSGVVVTFTPPAVGASGTFTGGNTATTNASGVATSNTFTANGAAGGPYNVVASATGATSANFALTNNNPVPVITPPLSPASANAGAATFVLTINGSGFVAGATVNFGSNPALTPTTITTGQITVSIPAADIATGGTPNVTVTNPAPGGGASNAVAFTINNPAPTLTSAKAGANTHAPGGAAVTLTVTGTLFVSTSVINFNGKAEPTTFVSATQLTAAIPASNVGTAGTFPVTVTNPAPGGGTTAAVNFTIDGYTVAGPAAPPSVKAGQQATIQLTITPSANGFTNAVSFTVSGLPAHSGPPTFSPASVTPGSTSTTTTLTIPTTAGGSTPPTAPMDPPTTPLLRLVPIAWFVALLTTGYVMRLARRMPQLRRYAAFFPLALLLITGAALAGCVGGKQGTPKGPAQLTITATSGTMTQTTNVTLTVN